MADANHTYDHPSQDLPSEYDAEDGRRRDEKAWKEWHEVNYPSEDPHKIEREAHFALQDRMFFKSGNPRVRALQDAIEGELDGLGISNEKAEAILRHIDEASPGKPRAWAVFAENRNLRIWSTDGEGIRKYAEQHNLPLTPLYAHPIGAPWAYRMVSPSRQQSLLTDDAGQAGNMLEHGWSVIPLVPGGWDDAPVRPAVGSLAEADSGGEPWGGE